MRFSPIEKSLFFLPLLAVAGAGLFWAIREFKARSAANTPITLNVAPDPLSTTASAGKEWVNVWRVKATPTMGADIFFAEKIVGSGHGHSQIIYSTPRQTPNLSSRMYSVTQYYTDGFGIAFSGLYSDLPVWMDTLEWQGEFVALHKEGALSAQTTLPSQILKLVRQPMATHITKKFPIPLSKRRLDPIQKCVLEPVNAQNAKMGADTCVTVQWKDSARRVFRQLSTFDGKIRRVLWKEGGHGRGSYWKSEQSALGSSISSNFLLFKLKDVPASWGPITFSIQAAYDPKLKAGTGAQNSDAATIQKLKQKGWICTSRELVVRPKQSI